MRDYGLRDRAAIVTGAGSGIGKATAIALAADGARVLVTDRDANSAEETARFITSNGGTVVATPMDVAVESDVEQGVARCLEVFGQIDIMVNNAGFALKGEVTAIPVDDWDRSFATNARGMFLGCKHVIPHMLERGSGAIVNVASRVGLRGIPNMAAYSSSKGAAVLLTYSLALEYAERGIRVNAVCPGPVATPALERFWPQFDDPEAVKQKFVGGTPMNRMADPAEIAEAIMYLASDGASYITGVALPVDGGRCAGQ